MKEVVSKAKSLWGNGFLKAAHGAFLVWLKYIFELNDVYVKVYIFVKSQNCAPTNTEIYYIYMSINCS